MGLGSQYLPKPIFSTANPYWQDPRKFWGNIAPEIQPKLSARDFLYATTWEIWRWDVQGAYCVRQATVLTVRINWKLQWRSTIEKMLAKQKEKLHEKVA